MRTPALKRRGAGGPPEHRLRHSEEEKLNASAEREFTMKGASRDLHVADEGENVPGLNAVCPWGQAPPFPPRGHWKRPVNL